MQKQCWWDAYTGTTHQQLYLLVTVIQEREIFKEKWRFVNNIRHLKRSDKKVQWRYTMLQEAIQIISQQGIKSHYMMANLVWVNTYLSAYVVYNSIRIVVCSTWALHTSQCVFAQQLPSIYWHAIHTKSSIFYCRRALNKSAAEFFCCTL